MLADMCMPFKMYMYMFSLDFSDAGGDGNTCRRGRSSGSDPVGAQLFSVGIHLFIRLSSLS